MNGRFLGCRETEAGAQAVLLGLPLDATGCGRAGVKDAPAAIRQASQFLEEYSLPLRADLREVGIYDALDLPLPPGNLLGALKAIEDEAQQVLAAGHPLLALGGEHLVTLPLVRAAATRSPDLRILQLDAHADLAAHYGGEPLTHATVMRRVVEQVGRGRLVQAGIRSGTAEEVAFAEANTLWFDPRTPAGLDAMLRALRGHPVYVTIDIDVLDPAFAPGVSTPEPGGWSTMEALAVLSALSDLEVVALDLVEVCPPVDAGGVTAVAAARLLRDAAIIFFRP
ncbi:MAG: agmatinase [candidate division NC10 bacterium]|nr:agmatinase [candidate division NC10 bacterium]